MKDAGIFLGHKKMHGFFWVVYFLSAQINNKINQVQFTFDVGLLLGMLKTYVYRDFFG